MSEHSLSEHTDLLPLRSPEEGGPAFELVRRGYDRDQVENHLGWLEDQLRNAEIARDAAEQAAASAAAEAESAREELESGRPQWHELGERITQILTLAEEQGAQIRAQRSQEADELLAEARQISADADRIHGSRIREGETQAQEIIANAQAEADRMLMRAQQESAEEERAAGRRLAELERQRDAVNAQLSRLHEALAAALAPSISIQEATPAAPSRPELSLPDDGDYEATGYADSDYEDDEYVASAPAAPASADVRRRP
jgi:cell division septum initiation protein DivIVA